MFFHVSGREDFSLKQMMMMIVITELVSWTWNEMPRPRTWWLFVHIQMINIKDCCWELPRGSHCLPTVGSGWTMFITTTMNMKETIILKYGKERLLTPRCFHVMYNCSEREYSSKTDAPSTNRSPTAWKPNMCSGRKVFCFRDILINTVFHIHTSVCSLSRVFRRLQTRKLFHRFILLSWSCASFLISSFVHLDVRNDSITDSLHLFFPIKFPNMIFYREGVSVPGVRVFFSYQYTRTRLQQPRGDLVKTPVISEVSYKQKSSFRKFLWHSRMPKMNVWLPTQFKRYFDDYRGEHTVRQ